ncbi:hypothetical protein EBE87_24570 [Pseudoroseomonas wenyumeiae]|uniref:Uncharacterized protein n=1 Tax=Teichococcus wenyumeiae TaxID=2478470 RepID=A0A3A9JDQ1_9PROT|nr:hypothetical protein [Pseudoroseomonas wenyumeiae]RKK03521.1 hypothetical protein D6Z83_14165 [Pseudoroseomonas wenyumeiae]RMI16980.1 hypothetical protein EBE87_24570 [Pseudoroseomonas wenyumeiae]
MSDTPVLPAVSLAEQARALGLERAATLFPDDVAAAFAAAMTNRAMLPSPPPAELEPWQPPSQVLP